MRILDENGTEITSPDLEQGYLMEERILIAHHPATPAVPEQWHYETIREYENGGKDIERVVDVPGVEARAAWDEYETILRYTPYTEEELAQRNAPTWQDAMEAQVMYTALLTDTILEG